MMVPDPAARREAYGLLRWGFLPASAQAWSIIRCADWYDAIGRTLKTRGLADAEEQLRPLEAFGCAYPDADAWQADYHHAFTTGTHSLLETDYTSTHAFMQARDLADIAGFYRAFGYEAAPTAGERVDHLGAELEFLYVLAHRERMLREREDEEGTAICLDATRKFLESHIGRFGPTLHERLEHPSVPGFFRSLAVVTSAVLRHDVSAFNLQPLPLPERATPTIGDDDGSCGPCPGLPTTPPSSAPSSQKP